MRVDLTLGFARKLQRLMSSTSHGERLSSHTVSSSSGGAAATEVEAGAGDRGQGLAYAAADAEPRSLGAFLRILMPR